MFLRKTKRREPVPITMSGVRMGERLLQVGVDDPAVSATIAAKVGLSGTAAAIAAAPADASRLRSSAEDAGALVDVQTAPLDRMPFPDGAFDVVVVHGVNGLLNSLAPTTRVGALRECHRVLRQGGRIVVIESGTQRGIAALLRRQGASAGSAEATGTVTALESAGFQPVRIVGDLEGFRFTEGLRKK
jgi:arsenite methyltransferase